MKNLILAIFLLVSSVSVAQTYGNEWVNYDLEYYRIRTSTDGIHKISIADIASAGAAVLGEKSERLAIYYQGEEQAVFVEDGGDGVLNSDDYILFYGKGKDGSLDTELYEKGMQPHTYNSLYTENSEYLITLLPIGEQGKRITKYYDNNYAGKIPPLYFMDTSVFAPTNQFTDIKYDNNGTYSEYTKEGWMSSWIFKNSIRTYNLSTPNFFSGGPKPFFNTLVYSLFDPNGQGEVGSDGNNHELLVEEYNTATKAYEVKLAHRHRGRNTLKFSNINLNSPVLGSSTTFRYQSNYLSRSAHVMAYIEVVYPRTFDINVNTALPFVAEVKDSYVEFYKTPTSYSNPRVWDFTNQKLIKGDRSGQTLKFNFPQGAQKVSGIVFQETNIISNIEIEKVVMPSYYNISKNTNYLIFSHSTLQSGAEAYAQYRSSPEGGAHKVEIVYADYLYNEFYFGHHHPLAIKNYLNFLIEDRGIQLQNVLILGKGYSYELLKPNQQLYYDLDLVPMIGHPVSDYLYVTGYAGSRFEPLVPIGRVPVKSNTEIEAYLNKVKLHESKFNPSKNIIQIVGGSSESENKVLKSYLDEYYTIASDTFLGATRSLYSKSSSIPVDQSLTDVIQEDINKGALMLSYFGHGAVQILEVDIGAAEDFDNKGKYPLFFFNGCILGNTGQLSGTLAEDFILQPEVGAINWVAGTYYNLIPQLYRYSQIFTRNLSYNLYGASVGELLQKTIDDFQISIESPSNQSHCRQIAMIGDPAIKYFAPQYPDYQIKAASLTDNQKVLKLQLENLGRANLDSVELKVDIQNAGNENYAAIINLPPILNTITYDLSLDSVSFSGLLEVTVTLDAANKLKEANENNNSYQFTQFKSSDQVQVIYPYPEQIVGKDTLSIVIMPGKEGMLEVALDSIPSFASSFMQQFTFMAEGVLDTLKIPLKGTDSTDYYFRVRHQGDQNWITGTFAWVRGSAPGWSQGYYTKFVESEKEQLFINDSTRNFTFGRGVSPTYGIESGGIDLSRGLNRVRIDGLNNYCNWPNSNSFNLMAINPDNLNRFMTEIPQNRICDRVWYAGYEEHPYYKIGNYSGAYQFDLRDSVDRVALIDLLEEIPQNYYLMGYSRGDIGRSLWEDEFKQALQEINLNTILSYPLGGPYGFFTQKILGFNATELFADTSLPLPIESQLVQFAKVIYPKLKEGAIISQVVGPSGSWGNAWLELQANDASDSFSLEVYGVSKNGGTELLITSNNRLVDLSMINAIEYPYLKLKTSFYDSINRTPIELNRWAINYTEPAEGIVVDATEIRSGYSQGENVNMTVAFLNIGGIPFKDLKAYYAIFNSLGEVVIDDTLDLTQVLEVGEVEKLELNISTEFLSGDYQIFVQFNPDKTQIERIYDNNVWNGNFTVNTDVIAPLLNVFADGREFINGSYLNPDVEFTFLVFEENQNLTIDQYSLSASFIYPDERKDSLTEFNTTFSDLGPVYTWKWKDELGLEAGSYIVNAFIQDKSGNKLDTLSKTFNVSLATSVEGVKIYPNPITSKEVYASFDLIGELPEMVNIKWYSIKGELLEEQELTDHIMIGSNRILLEGNHLKNQGVYYYQIKFELRNSSETFTGSLIKL